MRRQDGTLRLNRVERTVFAPPYRGKLRVAAAYSAICGLRRRPFAGVAEVAHGRYRIDTRHHEDWALLFGGIEQPQLRWILEQFPSMQMAWDVGAFHGYYTVALARVANFVHAFEPYPPSAAIVRENLALNGCTADVRQTAVGAEVGTTQLLLSINGPQNNSIVGMAPSGESLGVPVTTLDALTEEIGVPDLVKVDVECAELQVFQGATELLSRRRTAFLFESESWNHERAATHDLLRQAGYRLTSLVRGREVLGADGRMVVARAPG